MTNRYSFDWDKTKYPMGPFVSSPDDLPPQEREAYDILDLIVAEWETDPMSVQCFDGSIVARAKAAIAPYRQLRRGTRRP